MLRLPILDNPAHPYKIDIEGVDYNLRFVFNDRAAAWYFDILDADQAPIAQGIKIVEGWPLLGRVQDDRKPAGDFFMMFSQTGDDQIGREGFNDGARFYYFTAQDIIDQTAAPSAAVTLVSLV